MKSPNSNKILSGSTSGCAWLRLVLGAVLTGSCLLAHAARPQSEDAQQLTQQAVALDHGVGVPGDLVRAADLYCRAARLGYAPALYHLGWMYANARGVERDKAAASALMSLAAKQGHMQAQNVLGLLGGAKPRLPECMRDVVEESGLYRTAERRRVATLVKHWAPKYNVKPMLALAIITVESNFDPAAISVKNAQGLMQLIPETSARFNVKDPFDPEQNIRGGLAYLRWLLSYYRGDVTLVAASYNAGERAVDRYRGIPPYPETQNYVRRILSIVKQERHPYDAHVAQAASKLVL